MKDALRKIGINESITSASRTHSSEFTLIPNNDKSPNLSVNTQLETNDFDPTISIKSILDSNKVCFIKIYFNLFQLIVNPLHN